MGELENKVAIVTGGGRGFGAAIAHAYGAEGARVIVSDVDAESAERVARAIDGAESFPCDVREEEQVRALVERARDAHGRLDVMVANAGIATTTPLAEMDFSEWRALMSVNLDGVFLSLRHAAPVMAAGGGGTIVNMASITALAGCPLIGHYGAAKAAVVSLTKTAAVELRAAGIRVNAICPGFADTDMVRDHVADFEGALGIDFHGLINQKQGRLGSAEDVARLAVFLASDRTAFASGGAYVLDGGATASLL